MKQIFQPPDPPPPQMYCIHNGSNELYIQYRYMNRKCVSICVCLLVKLQLPHHIIPQMLIETRARNVNGRKTHDIAECDDIEESGRAFVVVDIFVGEDGSGLAHRIGELNQFFDRLHWI